MRILKVLFVFILIVVIVGGIGYYALTIYYGPNSNISSLFPWNRNQGTGTAIMPDQNSQGNMNMQGMNMTGSSSANSSANNLGSTDLSTSAAALQNRQKLMDIQNMVNQAIDLITMDPYSRVTMPGAMSGGMQMPQTQSGSGTINIYPNGTNSLNITPPANQGTASAPTAATPAANGMTAIGDMNMQSNTSYVYDQSKLEQLHRGIIRLAQGTMYLTQLNDDLTVQASTMDTGSNSYQTYINRYNLALRNKSRLNSAIASINQASELVNVNPYGSANGYLYNAQYMNQMHRGIYTLAQAMVLANDLNEDITIQMTRSLIAAQNSIFDSGMSSMGNIYGMSTTGSWSNILNPVSISTIFNLLLIIMIIVLIISIFGAIGNMFKDSYKNKQKTNTANESNI